MDGPTVPYRVNVWNERALRRHLQRYLADYHEWRTDLTLDKDALVPRVPGAVWWRP